MATMMIMMTDVNHLTIKLMSTVLLQPRGMIPHPVDFLPCTFELLRQMKFHFLSVVTATFATSISTFLFKVHYEKSVHCASSINVCELRLSQFDFAKQLSL